MRASVSLLSLVAAGVLLSACATTPPETEPALDFAVPVAWTTDGPAGSILPSWVDSFDDPELVALVRIALAQNHDLRLALTRLENAREAAQRAGADRLPSVVAGLDAARDGGSIQTERDSFSLDLSVSWEADIWRKVRDRTIAAGLDLEAAEQDYRAARQSLAANVVRAYFNAATSSLQLDLAEETAESFVTTADLIRRQFEAGLADALDLRLALANAENARNRLAVAERNHMANLRAIEMLIGRYPAAGLGIREDLPPSPAAVPAGLPADLLERRPDIRAAERALLAAGFRADAARKDLLPSLSLTGTAGTRSDDLGDLLDGDFSFWRLFAGLTQPIFQGGRLQSFATDAATNEERAALNYASVTLRAFAEVENALFAESSLAASEAALIEAAEQSQAAEELAWSNYQSGLANIITVLESQRRSLNAQTDAINARNNRLQNRVSLHLALGGDFFEPAEENTIRLAPALSRHD